MRFSGKIDLFRGQKTIDNPVFEELDDERVATGRLSPVYPLTEGFSNSRMRNLIHDVLDDFVRFVNDPRFGLCAQPVWVDGLAGGAQSGAFPR